MRRLYLNQSRISLLWTSSSEIWTTLKMFIQWYEFECRLRKVGHYFVSKILKIWCAFASTQLVAYEPITLISKHVHGYFERQKIKHVSFQIGLCDLTYFGAPCVLEIAMPTGKLPLVFMDRICRALYISMSYIFGVVTLQSVNNYGCWARALPSFSCNVVLFVFRWWLP